MILNKKMMLLLFVQLFLTAAWAQGPNGSKDYYKNADGKKGAALKTALRDIIYKHVKREYGQLWEDFQYTDKRADGKVWDMYSMQTFTFGSPYEGNNGLEGAGYNREHSFPKSWFDDGAPMYTDLHHLYPTDCWTNSLRNNHPYGETDSPTNGSTNINATGKSDKYYSKLGPAKASLGYDGGDEPVFEPADEYKGDLARTYFYMVTCYENEVKSWKTPMTVKGETYHVFRPWALKMLMRWSKNDPVSEKEINRNNAVADPERQANRNPFIDYPGLEDYIWGDKVEEAFSYDNYAGGGSGVPSGGGGEGGSEGGEGGGGEVTPVNQYDYSRVSGINDIEVGKSYVIVYEKERIAMAGRASGKNFFGQVTLDGAIYTTGLSTEVNAPGKPHSFLIEGSAADGYTIYDEADKVYLSVQSDSKNELVTSETATTDNEKWVVTIFDTNDALQLQNKAYTERYLWYNGGASRFTTYKRSSTTSGQIHYVTLFKKTTKEAPTGIASVSSGRPAVADGKMYNLNGQRVSSSYKGIVIMNGKKYVIK